MHSSWRANDIQRKGRIWILHNFRHMLQCYLLHHFLTGSQAALTHMNYKPVTHYSLWRITIHAYCLFMIWTINIMKRQVTKHSGLRWETQSGNSTPNACEQAIHVTPDETECPCGLLFPTKFALPKEGITHNDRPEGKSKTPYFLTNNTLKLNQRHSKHFKNSPRTSAQIQSKIQRRSWQTKRFDKIPKSIRLKSF